MRAIFVNHCHPDCPHVCGTRAREFANALARQGHQIVLLTESLNRDDPAIDPATLAAALAAHDWSLPFRLAVPPKRAPVLAALRGGRIPVPFRSGLIAYQYFARGGVVTDWREATQPYWLPLAEIFQPTVIWGIFGNTDAWAIAQGIARLARCPWVRDVKDRWTAFIAAPFRSALARRFGDASATTGLAQSLLDDAAPWLGTSRYVVYSGVPRDLMPVVRTPGGAFTLLVVGGTYNHRLLDGLLEGIAAFVSRQSEPVRLVYVGADGPVVEAASSPHGLTVDVRGTLPWPEYWSLVSQADVNIYVRIPGPAWHHKIGELLAARRPILCFPREIEEARQIAGKVGGSLLEAATPAEVAASLERLRQNRTAPRHGDASAAASLTWDYQADRLLAAFQALRRDGAAG